MHIPERNLSIHIKSNVHQENKIYVLTVSTPEAKNANDALTVPMVASVGVIFRHNLRAEFCKLHGISLGLYSPPSLIQTTHHLCLILTKIAM